MLVFRKCIYTSCPCYLPVAQPPESKNVPLQQLNNIVSVVKNTEIPLFVYCYSGARSRQATGMLQRMGYSKVNNIGGIAAYSGKVEK